MTRNEMALFRTSAVVLCAIYALLAAAPLAYVAGWSVVNQWPQAWPTAALFGLVVALVAVLYYRIYTSSSVSEFSYRFTLALGVPAAVLGLVFAEISALATASAVFAGSTAALVLMGLGLLPFAFAVAALSANAAVHRRQAPPPWLATTVTLAWLGAIASEALIFWPRQW